MMEDICITNGQVKGWVIEVTNNATEKDKRQNKSQRNCGKKMGKAGSPHQQPGDGIPGLCATAQEQLLHRENLRETGRPQVATNGAHLIQAEEMKGQRSH